MSAGTYNTLDRQSILRSDLPAITRHILLTLACHVSIAGDDDCIPSIARLSQETGLSEQTVASHLEIAKHRGWLA